MVADTVELTNYLRERFAEDKIYLVGNSWGATLGVLAAQQHPELYHAYVGAGQMVSQRETDILFYEDTLAWAQRTGQAELAATLASIGPPPYADVRHYEQVIGHEHEWNAYPELDLDNEMPAILFVPENTFLDRLNAFRGFLDSFAVLYPQLQEIDFRRTATELEVPVYMVLGEHEARGRAVPADEWFEMLAAPSKERIVFEGVGHRAHFDRPAEFVALMSRVLDETYAPADAAATEGVTQVAAP
jgi:pimeloyl-ACP methyl ester carboxylesterase